jgi:hypothetical protein
MLFHVQTPHRFLEPCCRGEEGSGGIHILTFGGVNMAQKRKGGLLRRARVYLSGPMDFVASRADEKKYGWRNRVGDFLRHLGVTVFDPWNKPEVRGFHEYGREGIDTTGVRDQWTFEDSKEGAEARARCSGKFWETLHIDLRIVDISDFIIAYCPTNIYSVGTPHEIVLCRQQRKPVLFVSPRVTFKALKDLKEHLKNDVTGLKLVERLSAEVPIKENPNSTPSLWYMTLVGGENFFDGFGFAKYMKQFKWKRILLDDSEEAQEIKRPLLPFLERLNGKLPMKWNNSLKRYVPNQDWLLWDLPSIKGMGAKVTGVRQG